VFFLLAILSKLLCPSPEEHLAIFPFIPFAISFHFLLFSHTFTPYFDNYPSYGSSIPAHFSLSPYLSSAYDSHLLRNQVLSPMSLASKTLLCLCFLSCQYLS